MNTDKYGVRFGALSLMGLYHYAQYEQFGLQEKGIKKKKPKGATFPQNITESTEHG